jgi:hypothetical protein
MRIQRSHAQRLRSPVQLQAALWYCPRQALEFGLPYCTYPNASNSNTRSGLATFSRSAFKFA